MGIFHRSHHLVALMPLAALLLQVFFLPSLVQAAPAASQDKCQIFCRAGQASVLRYDSGEYRYDFESEINTEVTLASPEGRRTKVKAEVVIVANSPCDFTIKVKDLRTNNDRGDTLEKLGDLNQYTGRFTLQEGIIGNICLDENEPTYSSNIKRAVISLLQNKALEGVSEREVVESDISGRCPTKYAIVGDDYVKTKNLNACLHREGGSSIFRGIPYEVQSNYNSVPDLASEQTCTQHLENGIYKSVTCTELHKLRKFLKKSEGVNLQTRVKTTLTLSGQKKGTSRIAQNPNAAKTSIFYDFSDHNDATATATAVKSVRKSLEQVCQQGIRPDGVTSEGPQFLLDLKKSLAHADKASLAAIYAEIKSGSFCQGQGDGKLHQLETLFLDTAAQAAGDGTIELLSELYQAGELSKVTKRYFYFYFNFAVHPHGESLAAVLPLIAPGGAGAESKRLILGVSGLAHQYCKTSNPNCGERAQYVAIVDRLAAIVGKDFLSTDENKQDLAVAALQALGNLDTLTPAAVTQIGNAIAQGNDRIKIRALDAFRRDPCQKDLKKKAQDLFAEVNTHANIRIQAYLANLRCLDSSDAQVIQGVLSHEESLQVGGFIQSHLNNLLRSSSPSTRQLKTAARSLSLQLKYPKELRRFSRHLESSFFNADLNLGYSAEGSIIFSKESFIPRQIGANLTVDALGQSYNVLELGVYLENFDHIQESIFGPHGKFPFDQKLTARGIVNQVLKLRNKRDTLGPVTLDRTGLAAIEAEVASHPHTVIEDDSHEAAIGDLYVRVFGTTLSIISLNSKRAPKTISDLKVKVKEIVGEAIETSKKELHFLHPILVSTDEVIVPTTSGFGLSSLLEANVVPSVDYNKDYHAPDGKGSPLDLKLKLGSNLAASVRGRHSLVGGPIETGIQIEGNLRTGGAIEIVLFKDENKFEARLNLPNDKVRAFDVNTNVVWVKRGPNRVEAKANFHPSLHVLPGSGPTACQEAIPALRIIGLKLCYRSIINTDENTPFILNGRQSFSASLEKSEPSMQGYAVLLTKQQDGNNKNFELVLDTPGSQQNRKLTLNGHIENDAQGKKKIDLELKTPNHSDVKFEYERTYTETLKGIVARLTLPSGAIKVDGHIKKTPSGNEITYEPHLSLEYPGNHVDRPEKRTFITGKVTRIPGQKLSVDISNQFPELGYGVAPLDLFLKGSVEVHRSGEKNVRYDVKGVELGVRNRDQDTTPNPVLTVNGFADKKEGEYNTDLEVKYGPNLDYQVTIHKTVNKGPGKFALQTKVILSQFPVLNFDLSSNVERSEGNYNSQHSFKLGPNGRQIQIGSESHVRVTDWKTNFDFSNKLRFAYQIKSYESSLETHIKHVAGEEQLVAVKLLASDGQGEKTKVTLNFDRKAAQNNDFVLTAALKAKHGQIDGQLTHTRTALNDQTHQSEGYTNSYKHETVFTSQSLGASQEKLVTYVRILNKEDAKGASLHSDFTSERGAHITFDAVAKSLSTEVVGDIRLKYKNDEVASFEVKGLKDLSSLVLNTYLVNQVRVHAARESKDPNHVVTNVKAEILRTGRTVTLDVDRTKTGDNTHVTADLKWDAVRDPTKAISLVSDNKVIFGSIQIESKNQITVVGQKVEVNLEAVVPSDVKKGEHSAAFQFVTTDGRSYQVKYSNALEIDPAHRLSNAKVTVNIPEIRPTEVTWKIESLNPNLKELVFDISAELAVSSGGVSSQNILAKLAASNNNNNGERTVQAKLALGGESIPESILVDSKLVVGRNTLRTQNSIQIGTTISSIELAGDLREEQETRIGHVKYVLTNLPLSKYQKIEGDLEHKRRLGGSFQLQRKHEIKLDGRTALKYSYALALLNEKLSAEAHVTSWDRAILDANVKGVLDAAQVDLSGHVTVNAHNVDVKLHVDKVNPLNLLQIRAETNDDGFSLKLQNTKQSPPTYALATNVKYHGASVHLDGELTTSELERGVSVKVTKTGVDGQTVNKELKAHYAKNGDEVKFDGLLSIGGQSVKVDGTALKVSGGYQGQVNYHVQAAQVTDGVVQLTVVVEEAHRKLSFKAGAANQPIDFLSVDYTKTAATDNTHYEGTFSTDLLEVYFEEPKLKGSFSAECHHLEGHGHDFTTTVNYDLSPTAKGALQTEFKLTGNEIRTFVQLTDNLHSSTFSEEFQVKKGLESEAPRQHKFRWVYKSNYNGAARTYGITFDAEKNTAQKSLDASLNIILGDEAKDVLGVHVYGKLKAASGLDINLPSRQISVAFVPKGAAAGSTGGELNVWLDKARNPDQKLTVKVEYKKLETADGAKGYEYTATVSHPALAKPLTVHRKVVRFGDLIVHDSTTELDLLDDPNNKILIVAKAAYTDSTHSQLRTELAIKSEGLGLLLQGEGDIKKESNSIVANLHYSFKNRNGELNSRNVEIAYSDSHQSILVGEKADPVLLLSRSVRDLGEHRRRRSVSTNTVDVRYEVHLPGMKDTRVLDIHLHGSVPPHLNLKTFTTGSDKTFEVSLGFPTERQLLLGVYRQVAQQRVNLAEFSVALNTTQLLSVKAKWDLHTIQEVLKTASERFEATGDNLQSTSEVYINEVSQDLQQVLEKLSTALPNLAPLQQRLKGELEEIKREWTENPTSQHLKELVHMVIETIEAASEPLQNALQVLNDLPKYLKDLKAKSPALVKKYEKLVRSLKIQLGKILKVILQTGRPIVLEIQNLVQRIRTRVDSDLKTGAETALSRVRTLGDNFYVKVVECFLTYADDIGRYLENSAASPEVKEFGVKILRYAVAKLKGQVEEADAIRQEITVKGRAAIEKLVGEILTVDLKHGVISALIPLPKPVNSLFDVRNVVRNAFPKSQVAIPYRNRLTTRLNILKQFFRDLVQTNFLTAVTRAFRTNTPPHSAQAYIIGSQYFITFDGKLFHHEGHCQYLLLSDFVHHDLTLAIDFEEVNGEIKKSIIVADKDETAVIHSDFSVTAVGKAHIEVTETEKEVKLTVEDHEATITCNKVSDVCTVSIDNGYLFGHVAGLLGTYNNEQYDDLRTPSGVAAESTEAFAASWKLNRQCQEHPIPIHPPVPSEASKLCSYAFSSRWSPLRSCFKVSDPSEFEQICTKLSQENGWTVKEAVCTAANAYEQTCTGINFNHLPFCKH